MNSRMVKIKNVLKELYAKYNHRKFIAPDPLQFVYKYSNRTDMEIAAFLASALAYGRVQQIEKSLDNLLGRMENKPYEFVLNFDKNKREKLKDFKHRFTTGDDISDLLWLLKKIMIEHGSIEDFFLLGYSKDDENIIGALSIFCDSLLRIHSQTRDGCASKGLRYLLASPSAGSACKRLNLFLRWMVRNDDIDTGLWESVDKAKLIVPIDVHMGRLCKILGLYDQKTISMSAALKITDSFGKIEPADPVKYDFALSRLGILENCTGRCRKECQLCELFEFCSHTP